MSNWKVTNRLIDGVNSILLRSSRLSLLNGTLYIPSLPRRNTSNQRNEDKNKHYDEKLDIGKKESGRGKCLEEREHWTGAGVCFGLIGARAAGRAYRGRNPGCTSCLRYDMYLSYDEYVRFDLVFNWKGVWSNV